MREVRMDRLWNEADLLDVLGPTYRADAAELAATYRWAAAEVERLTAELAEEKASRVMAEEAYGEASKWYAEAQAREKALRAITGLMAPHPRVWDDAWSNCCAEWDLRAGEVT